MVSGATKDKRSATRLLTFAKRMRREPTDAEAIFWDHVRNRGLGNMKFRRQVPVGPYIADFLCADERLIVEIDGGQHGGARDTTRDAALRALGYRVLRFWNCDVLEDLDAVLETVLAERPPHPALSPAGGEGERRDG